MNFFVHDVFIWKLLEGCHLVAIFLYKRTPERTENNMFASKYFNVGKVVVTHGINNIMTKNERFALEVALSLRRFCIKDFGNLSEEDKQVNEIALKHPEDLYLLGAYQTCAGKIWIITNATETVGMNVTTVLFPDER